ncbi:MAG: hypothetical protein JWM09_1573 [Francisellaceae bacterium]|nr:hypothetical protein [Francisellaceae bacterium]
MLYVFSSSYMNRENSDFGLRFKIDRQCSSSSGLLTQKQRFIHQQNLKNLIELLRKNPHINTLCLYKKLSHLGDRPIREINESNLTEVKRFKNQMNTFIDFVDGFISVDDIVYLIKHWDSLKCFVIESNSLKIEELKMFIEAITFNPEIKYLFFKTMDISFGSGSEDVLHSLSSIFNKIFKKTHIEYLVIEEVTFQTLFNEYNFNNPILKMLSTQVLKKTMVRSIGLKFTITDTLLEGMEALIASLKDEDCTLECLGIYSPLSESIIKCIFEGVSINKSLNYLSLKNQGFGISQSYLEPQLTQGVVDMLKKNKHLKYLILPPGFKSDSFCKIIEALNFNDKIKTIEGFDKQSEKYVNLSKINKIFWQTVEMHPSIERISIVSEGASKSDFDSYTPSYLRSAYDVNAYKFLKELRDLDKIKVNNILQSLSLENASFIPKVLCNLVADYAAQVLRP